MRLITILIVALSLTACSNRSTADMQTTPEQQDSAALRVAVMPTLDAMPLYVAEASGLFAKAGVDVRLVPFTAQMDCDTALLGARVEGAMTDLVRACRLEQQGLHLSYATSTNLTWQLLSNRTARIRQLKQLDDKMLAMTRYSATALLADCAVDSAELKSERIFRIQVNDVNVRLNMLETNIMDALLLPEPQATQARNLQAHVLLDTRRMGMQFGVLVFRHDTMNDTLRQMQIDLLMQAYNQACDSLNAHGMQAYRRLIEQHCHVLPATVDSLPADLHFHHAEQPHERDIEMAHAWLKKQ